jgi:hypothetical protein
MTLFYDVGITVKTSAEAVKQPPEITGSGTSDGVMILASASFIGTLYVVSLFFQDGRGMSALAAGLSTFPEALGVMAGAQLASRVLYPVLGPRRNIALGQPVCRWPRSQRPPGALARRPADASLISGWPDGPAR